MKYLTKENEKQRIAVLRRYNADWGMIMDIVEEGLNRFNPWDFFNEELYLERICRDGSVTYLFHYFDDDKSDAFKSLFLFIKEIIKTRLSDEIIEHYREVTQNED